jgi:drug/metabolite transporter (DMT)-like permease
MTVTVMLGGLMAAACWGVPDVWLAQATRNVGPFPVVFGSVLIVLAAQFATVAVIVATAFFGERPRRRHVVCVVLVIAAVTAIAAVSG